MKKLILSAVAGLAAATCVLHAEPPAPPPVQDGSAKPAKEGKAGKMKDHLGQMKSDLGLTDDQAAKIQQIMADQRKAMKGLKEDSSLTDDQKKQKHQAARAEVDAKISALLTPEQKAKWDEMKKNRPGKGGKKDAN